MSNITKADVDYIATLAHLNPDEETKERLARELGEILGYVEKLNELDTREVEPTMHTLDIVNVFREDAAEPSLERERALSNAPETDGEYFLVPRILEQE